MRTYAVQTETKTATPAPLHLLSPREREVLTLVARGCSNAELAAELVISVATVKSHLGQLLRKLRARDRVALVVLSWEAGLVTPATPHRPTGPHARGARCVRRSYDVRPARP